MCKDKKNGGLGIKDVSCFNRALLYKWKWRLLHEEEAIWEGISKHRYGYIHNGINIIKDKKNIWKKNHYGGET